MKPAEVLAVTRSAKVRPKRVPRADVARGQPAGNARASARQLNPACASPFMQPGRELCVAASVFLNPLAVAGGEFFGEAIGPLAAPSAAEESRCIVPVTVSCIGRQFLSAGSHFPKPRFLSQCSRPLYIEINPQNTGEAL